MKLEGVGDDYEQVLESCGIDPNSDGFEDEPLVPYGLSEWRMLTCGSDFTVDVFRAFVNIGRQAPVARLITERGLLSDVVLALGGSVDASYPLGALVYCAGEFLCTRLGAFALPHRDPSFLVGMDLYRDYVRSFAVNYSLDEVVDYMEGLAGCSLGNVMEG